MEQIVTLPSSRVTSLLRKSSLQRVEKNGRNSQTSQGKQLPQNFLSVPAKE